MNLNVLVGSAAATACGVALVSLVASIVSTKRCNKELLENTSCSSVSSTIQTPVPTVPTVPTVSPAYDRRKAIREDILYYVNENVNVECGPTTMRYQEAPRGCGLAGMQCLYSSRNMQVRQPECFKAIVGLTYSNDKIVSDDDLRALSGLEYRRASRRNDVLKQRAIFDGLRDWASDEIADGFVAMGQDVRQVRIDFSLTPGQFYSALINELNAPVHSPLMFRKGYHWIVIDKIDVAEDQIRIYDSLSESDQNGVCAPSVMSLFDFYQMASNAALEDGDNAQWDVVRFRDRNESDSFAYELS